MINHRDAQPLGPPHRHGNIHVPWRSNSDSSPRGPSCTKKRVEIEKCYGNHGYLFIKYGSDVVSLLPQLPLLPDLFFARTTSKFQGKSGPRISDVDTLPPLAIFASCIFWTTIVLHVWFNKMQHLTSKRLSESVVDIPCKELCKALLGLWSLAPDSEAPSVCYNYTRQVISGFSWMIPTNSSVTVTRQTTCSVGHYKGLIKIW